MVYLSPIVQDWNLVKRTVTVLPVCSEGPRLVEFALVQSSPSNNDHNLDPMDLGTNR